MVNEAAFTHLDDRGAPRMVDVAEKPVTRRVAVAEGRIQMSASTVAAIREDAGRKGPVLAIAQLAGIMGAKRTAELIPLCHPLPLTSVEMELEIDENVPAVVARATARVDGKTGVEMEALTAVATALLTIYDMCKARDRGMIIEQIRLVEKAGGRSGAWSAPAEE